MDIITALNLRQSISKVRSEAVPRAMIEELLTSAVQAPNHHRVRPWRFVVLTGEARNRLGDVMAAALKQRDPATPEAALDVERSRPLRAPLLIAVGVEKPSDPKVIEIENVCASAAAVENLLLAATGLGLGAIWRSGPAAFDPVVKAFLGFQPDQHIIGFVYIGYLDGDFPPKTRSSFEDRTLWME